MESPSIVQRAGVRRDTGIDLFRGVLIVAVILGHFSELTERHNFVTWFGFGFRMPLFIGLTGYLFNLELARSLSLQALFRKYHRRLIFPWLIACAVHLTITRQFDWLTPLYIFVRPPYHLWFVPIMLAFIFAARLSRLTPTAMLGIAIPLSIAAMYIFGVGHTIEQYRLWMPDRRFFVYPIYFTFGMWIARRRSDPWSLFAPVLLASIGLLWWCRLYHLALPAAEVAAELILCLPLIGLLPRVRGLTLDLPLLASLGRDSLFFYLWHPLTLGLWASCGASGLPMLLLALLSMILARSVIARMPRVRGVLGVQPPEPVVPAPALAAPGAGSLERAL